MARRKIELGHNTPAVELELKNSISCPNPAWAIKVSLRATRGAVSKASILKQDSSLKTHSSRNKKSKTLYRSTRRMCRNPLSCETRAQAFNHRQVRSSGCVTRQQFHLQQLKTGGCSDPLTPLANFCTPKTPIVAATSSDCTPRVGLGPATRSRTDRLRVKISIETPDTSSNGEQVVGEVVDHPGEAGHHSRSVLEDLGALEDGEEGISKKHDLRQDKENDVVAHSIRKKDDIDSEVTDGGSEDQEEENEGDELGDLDDEMEDSSSCCCTSTWSCGSHACQKQAGPSCSTPRLLVKRPFSPGMDEADCEGTLSKRACRLSHHSSCGQGLPSGSGLKVGNPGAIIRPTRQRIPSREHPPPHLQQWLETFKSWSNAERLMALDDLITHCEPSQVRHVMHVIEPQFQRDFISLLPKELALYVLSFLEPKDLLRAAQTCKYWHVLCEDNLLWREKCREEGIDENLVYGTRLRRRPGSRSPCKSLYMRQAQIEQNWRTGTSKTPKILKGHDDHVITCLEFCGHRIVSGSDDNTLKVWSVISGKCLRTLTGHTGGVWSSQMSGNIIISGSTDRTLKVWNADSGVCKHTLCGHTSTVRCMSLCGNRVVSGSRDATLRVWDIDSGHCQHVLMGHVAAVRCVQFDGRRVVSGAYDYTVRVWDPDTETCIYTLQGHSNRVYSLQFDGVHVVSGSLDTSIRVWDLESGTCLHTLIGHQSLTSGLELKDNILVSGNADSTVKVWDITTGQCLQTLQGPNKHQSAVTWLQFSKKFVITSSDDGTVKIWDLKTGEFLRNLVSLDSGGSGGVVWRLRCSNTKLVCAVGSRNGTEETKLMVLDFDVDDKKT